MDFADTVREVVPFTDQVKCIEERLGEIGRGDETALYNAVYLASERLGATSAAAGRRRVLVVISDGGDSVSGKSYEEAVEEAERAGAMVYSIIIVPIAADAGRNTGGEHTLIQMSEDTGGKYYNLGRTVLPGAGVPPHLGRPEDAVFAGLLRASRGQQRISPDQG